ncbi:restriction endonuclease [Sediminibacillus massiliensis]|uniref:restriction endonuclease n=1 Tax=Sediminibacillus massiliensis TaxID=1926277 RepID=UPI0009884801|nr:restriction endonuclease [Sediminibacillus massiliensis]
MNNEKLYSKIEMSRIVGWSEANGRRWVKNFKEYFPTKQFQNRVMYTNESLRNLKTLKKLNEEGLTSPVIKDILKNEEFPSTGNDIVRIINKYKVDEVRIEYDEKIKSTIPSMGEMMIPYLEMIKDGKAYSASEITDKLVNYFKLSEEQRIMRYEHTPDSILLTRVRSVRYSLKKGNYIEEINKLTYRITSDGLDLLNESNNEIKEEIEELEKVVDPLTIVKEKLNDLKEELADSLLKQLRNVHWMKFEDIVVELLTVMGYGDGRVTQRSNDEGIDGIIKEDKLGLDNIYVQAKRYAENQSIGRNAVQGFSGALDGKARKGVFITTSKFTDNARTYVESLEAKKIILIDGLELANLMISYDVGVDVNHTFVVKAIDYDYFKDE